MRSDFSYTIAIVLLLLAEAVLTLLIVYKVPYTEIDWEAYMQEVEGVVVSGELNYYNLKGNTGPLVYPAGFVYLYTLLWWLTDYGKSIFKAQIIFSVLYVATQTLVPAWALVVLCLSKRIHSIFVLRLFNDCFAMAFLYAAILAFCYHRWSLGSVLFSLGVSIKMNVMLFAFPLFWIYILVGGFVFAFRQIFLCGVVQLVLGLPFLATYPLAYLHKSFELDRVFMYKWTVNWKCIAEEIFLHKTFARTLLLCHLLLLFIFFLRHGRPYWSQRGKIHDISPKYIAGIMCAGQLAGIVFSRTLHYQFYSWYFHTLPILLWLGPFPTTLRIIIMLGIEISFNVYPSTANSSLLLHGCHALLLSNILFAKPWRPHSPKKD